MEFASKMANHAELPILNVRIDLQDMISSPFGLFILNSPSGTWCPMIGAPVVLFEQLLEPEMLKISEGIRHVWRHPLVR